MIKKGGNDQKRYNLCFLDKKGHKTDEKSAEVICLAFSWCASGFQLYGGVLVKNVSIRTTVEAMLRLIITFMFGCQEI